MILLGEKVAATYGSELSGGKKTSNQNGGTRNLLMQYFTPVPYGFICQIKRREKKHRTMKTATVWIARSLRYTKYEETREEGKKPNKK